MRGLDAMTVVVRSFHAISSDREISLANHLSKTFSCPLPTLSTIEQSEDLKVRAWYKLSRLLVRVPVP